MSDEKFAELLKSIEEEIASGDPARVNKANYEVAKAVANSLLKNMDGKMPYAHLPVPNALSAISHAMIVLGNVKGGLRIVAVLLGISASIRINLSMKETNLEQLN